MGGKTLKKKIKIMLALFLVMTMVFTGMPLQHSIVAKAEGEAGSDPDWVIKWSSTAEDISSIEGALKEEDGTFTIESLTIESGHFVIIEGATVHINTLTLEEDARVEVLNDEENPETHFGNLSWNTINASNGARILMQNGNNLPTVMRTKIYKRGDEANHFSQISPEELLGKIGWTEVEFTVVENEDPASGRWVWNSYDFDCFGPTEYTIVIEVEICDFPELSNENFPFILPEGITEENSISGGDRVKFRVPNTTEAVNLGWTEAGRPRQIAIDNNTGEEQNNWIIIEDDASMSGGKYTLQLNLTDGENPRNYYYVQFKYGPANEGGTDQENEKLEMVRNLLVRLNEEQSATPRAYGNQVKPGETINDTENTAVDDLKLGWAKYLAEDFAVGEGRYQGLGEAIGLGENSEENKSSNIEKVLSMISADVKAEKNITAKDSSGNSHELTAYSLTFTPVYKAGMFTTEELASLTQTATTTAYLIQTDDVSSGNTYEQVVIKIGNEYYIRNAGRESNELVCLGANDNKDNTRALNIVTTAYTQPEDVILFGNNANLTDEILSDASAQKYYVRNFWSNDSGLEFGGKLAIYNPNFTGVFVKPDTESTKEALAWELNTSYDIKESGEAVETDFYFGYSKAILSAITGDKLTGLNVKKLSNVEVLGDIPDNAVKVTSNGDDTFTVQFLSDYYDEVELKLTYLLKDDTTIANTLTINRVGIVVQYGRTPGDSKTKVEIHHGHASGEFITDNGNEMSGVIYATYYHPQGTIEADKSDTSLYVTFHYKDGTTEQKIVKADFFTNETSENTAMSDYVLAIAPNGADVKETLPIKVDVIAVENADANGRFNGAKLGAGKGVQCEVEFDD